MKPIQYIGAAAVILTAALSISSCKGRHADATPNGETVEVNPATPASDDSVNAGISTDENVKMEVTVTSPIKEK